jgi:glycerophosphoryl diester phosphodiesterase
MRSSPSGPDPLNPGPAGFAHRGLHSGSTVPENTLAAFEAAVELGAGIECDLRLTADDRIIVFHDADARRLCASPLRIGKSKWKELVGLRIGSHPIPSLENLLGEVAGRVPLLLEVKTEGDLPRWGPALKRELAGYLGPFGLLSFDARLLRRLRSELPGIRRGLNVSDSLPSLRRKLAIRIADPDFLGVELSAIGESCVARARSSMPVYCWTIRTPEERAQAEVQADALIWEGDGRPRN